MNGCSGVGENALIRSVKCERGFVRRKGIARTNDILCYVD
jgi:hypothetical protein